MAIDYDKLLREAVAKRATLVVYGPLFPPRKRRKNLIKQRSA